MQRTGIPQDNNGMIKGSAFFDSTDGRHIFEQWWRPPGPARGAVAIRHGFAEHGGRYEEVARELNGRGYVVEALDLRGHGRSDGPRAHVNSFAEYLADVDRFLANARRRNPAIPLFLLGHSMGGGVVTLLILTRQPALAGVVLSGPALRLVSGDQPFHQRVIFALMSLAPRLRLPALAASDISRDPEVVRKYEEDPLVHRGGPTVGLAKAGARATERIARDMEGVELPLLVLHGTDDTLVPTAGSEELTRRAKSADKTLKLYNGLYHEVFNEPERLDVLSDVAAWLDQRTVAVE